MHRIRSVHPSVWMMALLFAIVPGCDGGDAHLHLSWKDFDQNPHAGWRPLATDGEYADAARMIESYLDHRSDLLPAQRGYSRFHAGQLWAMHGDTVRALEFLDGAVVEDMPPEFPRSFNALVVGTRSFLRGDMKTVSSARSEVADMPGLTSRDSTFLDALDLLSRSEGLSYLEVYELAVE